MVANSKTVALVAAAGTVAALGCYLMFIRKKKINGWGWFSIFSGKRRSSMGIEETQLFIGWIGSNESKEMFLNEIIKAEQCLARWNERDGIVHLCKAFCVCNGAACDQFLTILKGSLSRSVYIKFLNKLPPQQREPQNMDSTKQGNKSNAGKSTTN